MSNMEERLKMMEFFRLVGKLKHIKRTGWVLNDVYQPENVAGHMYRMAVMSFLLDGSDGLDTVRCMKLALVHDLAECIVGDITPKCGIPDEDKHLMEMVTMENICPLVGNAGEEILTLFKEYEAQETVEARTVKDLDVYDMILQAYEYENEEGIPGRLQEFFDSTDNHLYVSPLIGSLVAELHRQRNLSASPNFVPYKIELGNLTKTLAQLPIVENHAGGPATQKSVNDQNLPVP